MLGLGLKDKYLFPFELILFATLTFLSKLIPRIRLILID